MEQPSEQQLFDTVVNHLRKQGAKSIAYNEDGTPKYGNTGSVMCLYRSTDGKKCAAGAAITDEQYKLEMEGKNIRAIINKFNLTSLSQQEKLLSHLQDVHDFHEVPQWEELFEDIARQFQLTYTPPFPPRQ
jgi:hypothetical protein